MHGIVHMEALCECLRLEPGLALMLLSNRLFYGRAMASDKGIGLLNNGFDCTLIISMYLFHSVFFSLP